MRQRLSEWRRRALVTVVTMLPSGLVRKWAGLVAGLMRFGGVSAHGELALSRALALLVDAPHVTRHAPESPAGVAEIAVLVGRSEDEVARWAAAGMLGEPVDPGPPRLYAPEALERARLVVYLRRHGVDEDALADAAARNRLPLIIVDQALGGRGALTATQVARRAGVSAEFAESVWHALGMPHADADEPVYTRRDVEALRILGALRTVYADADLLDTIAVVGRAMASIASAQVELFRRGVVKRLAEAGVGELEAALRVATLVDILRPSGRVLLDVAYQKHLESATSAESAWRIEEATGSLPGQVTATVGFADLVGFTAASNRLTPLELGELSSRLQRTAEAVFSHHGVRVVKSIGDAVMFAGREPLAVIVAAVELVEAARQVELDALHVGVASGPVLRRHADYFGRTVNVASRLCATARADEVLVAWPVEGVGDEQWEDVGLAVGRPEPRHLKGLGRSVEAVAVARAGIPQVAAG